MFDLTPAEQVNRRIQNERNEALNRIRVLEEALQAEIDVVAIEQAALPTHPTYKIAPGVQHEWLGFENRLNAMRGTLSTSVGSSDAAKTHEYDLPASAVKELERRRNAETPFCARCNNTGYTAPGEACMECAMSKLPAISSKLDLLDQGLRSGGVGAELLSVLRSLQAQGLNRQELMVHVERVRAVNEAGEDSAAIEDACQRALDLIVSDVPEGLVWDVSNSDAGKLRHCPVCLGPLDPDDEGPECDPSGCPGRSEGDPRV